jgi:osmotically-inducible protein OsmY
MSCARALLIGFALVAAACGPGDDSLARGVRDRMASDPVVNAYPVNVAARNKVVTLTGTVGSDEAKRQAVRVAREQEGVLDVIDRLRVSEAAATTGR